jgi:hypothetical protein
LILTATYPGFCPIACAPLNPRRGKLTLGAGDLRPCVLGATIQNAGHGAQQGARHVVELIHLADSSSLPNVGAGVLSCFR